MSENLRLKWGWPAIDVREDVCEAGGPPNLGGELRIKVGGRISTEIKALFVSAMKLIQPLVLCYTIGRKLQCCPGKYWINIDKYKVGFHNNWVFSFVIALQKRPDQISLNCTLLKRGIS